MAGAAEAWEAVGRVALVLGYDKQTVRRWCRAGAVVCFRSPSGRGWRVLVDGRGLPVRRR